MQSRTLVLVVGGVLVALAIVVVVTLALTPDNTNAAFAVASRFVNTAVLGDDETAYSLLTDDLQAYVDANCPDGSVSACVQAYTPAEWGLLVRDGGAVFRRAIPDGPDAWDVAIIATYQEGQGFSGVCVYNRVERTIADNPETDINEETWRVAAWSGFVSCDLPESGLSELREPNAVNRVP